jgi:hypothetical protein
MRRRIIKDEGGRVKDEGNAGEKEIRFLTAALSPFTLPPSSFPPACSWLYIYPPYRT